MSQNNENIRSGLVLVSSVKQQEDKKNQLNTTTSQRSGLALVKPQSTSSTSGLALVSNTSSVSNSTSQNYVEKKNSGKESKKITSSSSHSNIHGVDSGLALVNSEGNVQSEVVIMPTYHSTSFQSSTLVSGGNSGLALVSSEDLFTSHNTVTSGISPPSLTVSMQSAPQAGLVLSSQSDADLVSPPKEKRAPSKHSGLSLVPNLNSPPPQSSGLSLVSNKESPPVHQSQSGLSYAPIVNSSPSQSGLSLVPTIHSSPSQSGLSLVPTIHSSPSQSGLSYAPNLDSPPPQSGLSLLASQSIPLLSSLSPPPPISSNYLHSSQTKNNFTMSILPTLYSNSTASTPSLSSTTIPASSQHPIPTNLSHLSEDATQTSNSTSETANPNSNSDMTTTPSTLSVSIQLEAEIDDSNKNTKPGNRISILPDSFLDKKLINMNSLLLEMNSELNPARVSRNLVNSLIEDMKRFPFKIPLLSYDKSSSYLKKQKKIDLPYISLVKNSYLDDHYRSILGMYCIEEQKEDEYLITCEELVSKEGQHHLLFSEWKNNKRDGRLAIINEKGQLFVLSLVKNGLLQDYLLEINDGCLQSLNICNEGAYFQFMVFQSIHKEPWYYFSLPQEEQVLLQAKVYFPRNTLLYEGSVKNSLTNCFPFEGEGTYYQNNQVVYKGKWKDGKPDYSGNPNKHDQHDNLAVIVLKCMYLEIFANVLKDDYTRKNNAIQKLSFKQKWYERVPWFLLIIIGVVIGVLFWFISSTKAPECMTGSIFYLNDYTWYGCINRGVTAGRGTLYNEKGLVVYKGRSVNNQFEGKGTSYEIQEIWKDEELYVIEEESFKLFEGEWHKNEMKRGCLYLPRLYPSYHQDVLWYNGSFKNGKREGSGIEYWPLSCKRFIGEFKDDKMWYGKLFNSACDFVYEGYVTDSTFTVSTVFDYYRLNPCITELHMKDLSFLKTPLDLSNATQVETLFFEDGSLQSASLVEIHHLSSLTRLLFYSHFLIPHPSFTYTEYLSQIDVFLNSSSILSIHDNPHLQTIQINGRSMYEVTTLCIYRNENLENLIIHFFPEKEGISAFMFLTQFELANLPHLTSFSIPSFMSMPYVSKFGFVNLPSIQSIVIGAESMKGYTQSSLYIQNCPELRYIIIGAGACQFISRILIKDVPKLNVFQWEENAFGELSSITYWEGVSIKLINDLSLRYPSIRFRNVTFSYKGQEC